MFSPLLSPRGNQFFYICLDSVELLHHFVRNRGGANIVALEDIVRVGRVNVLEGSMLGHPSVAVFWVRCIPLSTESET